MKRKLILFDVDGTLITRCRLHEESFSVAFKKVFGIDADINEISPIGKTDKKIIIEVMKNRGLSEEQILSRLPEFYQAMIKHVEEKIWSDNSFKPIDRVKELLEELKKKGYVLGLVTGNLEKLASLKLRKLGLLGFFKVGGFGESSENREELIQKAIYRAEEKYGSKFQKKYVLIIGDTPKDIEAAKKAGVKAIAFSTGPFQLKELKRHNPDYLFKDFSDKESIIKAIEG